MPLTQAQLLRILPNARLVADVFVPVLNAAMEIYQITTSERVAAFIAQVGHESGQLMWLVENLNYSAQALRDTWPGRFDVGLANRVARQPEQIANIAYASRMGNGSPASGDGWNYRGRGLIQVTGKDNYRQCGEALALDLITQPYLLEIPTYAALSAGWFWASHGLNKLADNSQFEQITRRINGGLHGLAERQALHVQALRVLT